MIGRLKQLQQEAKNRLPELEKAQRALQKLKEAGYSSPETERSIVKRMAQLKALTEVTL